MRTHGATDRYRLVRPRSFCRARLGHVRRQLLHLALQQRLRVVIPVQRGQHVHEVMAREDEEGAVQALLLLNKRELLPVQRGGALEALELAEDGAEVVDQRRLKSVQVGQPRRLQAGAKYDPGWRWQCQCSWRDRRQNRVDARVSAAQSQLLGVQYMLIAAIR